MNIPGICSLHFVIKKHYIKFQYLFLRLYSYGIQFFDIYIGSVSLQRRLADDISNTQCGDRVLRI